MTVSWSEPGIPDVTAFLGDAAASPLWIWDTRTGHLQQAWHGDHFSSYVCGITPYDATHLGHARTYLTFDLMHRLARAAGLSVHYTQNVTDVDDPLLDRAARTGRPWQQLAGEQTELFRQDMAYLGAIPPTTYQSVTEHLVPIARQVARLLTSGYAYLLPVGRDAADVYLDSGKAALSSEVWDALDLVPDSRAEARAEFAEHGGDPERPGKRHPLDALLWRGRREGEPWWRCDGLPDGRPGWHIECAVIAHDAHALPYDVQGGGADLAFPHHAYSSAHAVALYQHPIARVFSHVGLVSLNGAKMSKSLGNLVFVRSWRDRGIDPSAVRLAIFSHHYREAWEWKDGMLSAAAQRLLQWRRAAQRGGGSSRGSAIGRAYAIRFRDELHRDLNTAAAWAIADEWSREDDPGQGFPEVVDALTGVHI